MSIIQNIFRYDIDSADDDINIYHLSENEPLKERINTLNRELSSKSQENFNLLQANKNLTEQNQILSLKLSQLNGQINSYKITVEKLQSELTNNSSLILNLKHQISQSQNEQNNVKNSLMQNQFQLTNLTDSLSQKENTIKTHLDTISVLKAQKEEVESLVEKLQNENNELRKNKNDSLLDKNSQISKLEQEKYALQSNINQLQAEKESLQKTLEYIQSSHELKSNNYQINLRNNLNELEDLKTSLGNIEIEINNKNFTLSTLKKNNDDLFISLDSAKRALIQLQNENYVLTQLLNDKQHELKAFQNYQMDLEINNTKKTPTQKDIDFEKLKSAYMELKTNYNQQILENNQTKTKNEVLSKQLSEFPSLKDKYSNILQQNLQLIQENNELKQNLDVLDNLKHTLKVLQVENRRLLLKNPSALDLSIHLPQSLPSGQYENYIYTNIESLESKMTQLVSKNISLENQIQNLTRDNESLSNKLEEYKKHILEVEEYIKEVEQLNQEKTKAIDFLKNSFSSSGTEALNMNYEAKRLYDELNSKYANSLKNEQNSQLKINLLENKINEEKENSKLLEIQINKLNSQLGVLNNNILSLQNQLKETQVKLNNSITNENQLINEKQRLEFELKESQNINVLLTNDKNNLTNTVNDLIKQNKINFDNSQKLFDSHLQSFNDSNKDMKKYLNSFHQIIKGDDNDETLNNNKLRSSKIKLKSSLIADSSMMDIDTNDNNNLVVEQLKQQIQSLQITVENLTSENSMLKYQLNSFNNNSKILSQNEIIQQVTQALESNSADLKQKISKLSSEKESYHQEIHSLQKKIEQLTKFNNDLVNKDISSPYNYLMYQLNELASDKVKLTSENEQIKQKMKLLEANLSNVNEDKQKEKILLDKIEKVNKKLTKENEEMIHKFKSFDKEKKEKELQITNNKIKELQDIIKNLEEDKKSLIETEKNLRAELENKSKILLNTKSSSFNEFYGLFLKSKKIIPFLSNASSILENRVQNLTEKVNRYTDKISKLELLNISKDKEISEKTNQIKTLERELKKEKEKYEHIHNIIQNNKSETDPNILKKQIVESFNKMYSNYKKIMSYLEYLNEKNSSLEEEKNQLIKEKEKLKSENESYKMKLPSESKKDICFDIDKNNLMHLENENLNLKTNTDYISNELSSISNFIKTQNETMMNNPSNTSNDNHSNHDSTLTTPTQTQNIMFKMKPDYEKTKTYARLVAQMRKAIKLINFLLNMKNNDSNTNK